MDVNALRSWMASYVDEKKFNGCSLLVLKDNKLLLDTAFGYADRLKTKKFTSHTIVRIFSMTKAIVSTCLLALVEKEKIPLDTKISTFLPEFKNCYALIDKALKIDEISRVPTPTIAQILNHTSGFSYFFNGDLVGDEYMKRNITTAPNNINLKTTINKLSEVPLCFRPGTKWNYSVGIDLAGRIIEIISGKSLELFLDEFLFVPLDMKDTSFYLPEKKIEKFADCFFFEGMTENFRPLEDLYKEFLFRKDDVTNLSGGSGLLSTAIDYSKFASLILNNGYLNDRQILSNDVVLKIRSNSLSADIASIGVKSFAQMSTKGMGHSLSGSVVVSPSKDFPSNIGDFGWGGMGSNYFWIDFRRRIVCIFMVQLIPSSAFPNRKELKTLMQ